MRDTGRAAIEIGQRPADDRRIEVRRTGTLRIEPEAAFQQDAGIAGGIEPKIKRPLAVRARGFAIAKILGIGAAQPAPQLMHVPVRLDAKLALVTSEA